jgi:hypothetical protein
MKRKAFRLCARLHSVYPPKVEDKQVLAVIRELTVDGTLPSGAALRAVLERRHHSRGGVSRIYRLLGSERARRGATALSAVGMGLLEQENRNLRELLQEQRQREDAHQAHWNREVGRLRERVNALEPLLQQAAAQGEVTESLKQEVQGAETRGGQLEVQLRAFGPAANRGNTTR